MSDRSEGEIEKWSSIVRNLGDPGVMRLRRYICSLMLGRDFGEDVEEYFNRQGLAGFSNWAHKILKEV